MTSPKATPAGGKETRRRSMRRLCHQCRWFGRTLACVLVITVFATIITENGKPGFYYNTVGSKLQGIFDLGDRGAASRNRQAAADLARAAADWPETRRVGWPDVTTVDVDSANLPRQLAHFSVYLDPSQTSSTSEVSSRALGLALDAAEAGFQLRLDLCVEDSCLALTDVSSDQVTKASALFDAIRADDEVRAVHVTVAATQETTPPDWKNVYVSIVTERPGYVDRTTQRWIDAGWDYGLTDVVTDVREPEY